MFLSKLNKTKIFSYVAGLAAFMLLLSPVLVLAQPDTVDLSENSIINDSNLDGSQQGIADLILNVASFIIFIVGAVSVLFLIWGAIQILISAGDDAKVKSGRSTIISSVVGLAIAILSFTIVSLVQTLLTNGSLSGVFGG